MTKLLIAAILCASCSCGPTTGAECTAICAPLAVKTFFPGNANFYAKCECVSHWSPCDH